MADETIRVVLEGDASSLEKEFRRARDRAEDFAKKTLPLTQAEMTRVWTASQRVTKGLREQSAATGRGRDGMLQLAQAADDVQYGMRSIMNNIPGLVMGFGGSSGLAGGISLAVLGLYAFDKALRKFSGVAEIEKMEEAWTAAAKVGGALGESLREQNTLRKEGERLEESMGRRGRDERERLERLLSGEGSRLKVLEGQERVLRRKRQLEDELARAREGVEQARGGGGPGASREGEIQREMSRVQEDAALAAQRAAAANAEYNRVLTAGSGELAEYRSALAAVKAEMDALRERNAPTQAEAVRAKAVLDAIPEGKGGKAGMIEQQNLAAAQERAREEASRLRFLVAEASRLKEGIDLIERKSQEARDAAQREAEGARAAVLAGNEELKVKKELLALERERVAATVRAASAEADAAFRERQAQGLAERAEYEQARRGKVDRLREFAGEQKVLELRARGREKDAAALERELRIQREKVALARETGLSERQAEQALRRRAALEDAVRDGSGRERRSGIRRTEGIEVGRGGMRSRLDVRGLRESRGLSRTAEAVARRERAEPDRSFEAAARSYYEKDLQTGEALVKALQAIGVY